MSVTTLDVETIVAQALDDLEARRLDVATALRLVATDGLRDRWAAWSSWLGVPAQQGSRGDNVAGATGWVAACSEC
jgi:hypothetical protein